MRSLALLALLIPATSALAQDEGPAPVEVEVVGGQNSQLTVAVPAMPGLPVGRGISEVIASDLRSTGGFTPIGPNGIGTYGQGQAGSPNYGEWRSSGAGALVTGYAEARPDGRLTVACYLHDVTAGRLLANQGFTVTQSDWRRAAHKCADAIYSRLSGESPFFDSRIAYIAESGPKNARVKRLAIMDSDGANHRFLTNGQSTVLTPRFAPNQQTIAFMSYENNQPRVYVYDVGSGRARPLVSEPYMTFAPRFSPDGRSIVFSMAVNGNTDIYRISVSGGRPQRLTNSAAIDDGGSYSPDGSRIVFESDRGGTQQLYVMNADGSNQHRISFGGGRYGTPVWSPRGDLIAFTQVGTFRIGVMAPDGSGERILSNGPLDEGPTWAPNGRVIMFGRGNGQIWSVDITGMAMRRVPTPLGASDPSWSPLRD
jgi:TolB protein